MELKPKFFKKLSVETARASLEVPEVKHLFRRSVCTPGCSVCTVQGGYRDIYGVLTATPPYQQSGWQVEARLEREKWEDMFPLC